MMAGRYLCSLLAGRFTAPSVSDSLSVAQDDFAACAQVELTARRTLSFLSGGDLVPLLGDILYPSEKELLAERLVMYGLPL